MSAYCCFCPSAAVTSTCFWRRQMAIEYSEVYTVRLSSQPPRLLHIIKQTNVGLPRHDFDFLSVGRLVYKLVESILDIVMHKLLPLSSVVCDVACNIWRGFKADRPVKFYQPHFPIKVVAEQLT